MTKKELEKANAISSSIDTFKGFLETIKNISHVEVKSKYGDDKVFLVNKKVVDGIYTECFSEFITGVKKSVDKRIIDLEKQLEEL